MLQPHQPGQQQGTSIAQAVTAVEPAGMIASEALRS